MRGFEYAFEQHKVEVKPDATASLTVRLRPMHSIRRQRKWVSGDVHTHMNYAGTYRNTPDASGASRRPRKIWRS